jgi:hypothetical protein
MNVGIGSEAALFPEKEYIMEISFAVYAPHAVSKIAWSEVPIILLREVQYSTIREDLKKTLRLKKSWKAGGGLIIFLKTFNEAEWRNFNNAPPTYLMYLLTTVYLYYWILVWISLFRELEQN